MFLLGLFLYYIVQPIDNLLLVYFMNYGLLEEYENFRKFFCH